jgi:hypothetical protein
MQTKFLPERQKKSDFLQSRKQDCGSKSEIQRCPRTCHAEGKVRLKLMQLITHRVDGSSRRYLLRTQERM